MSDNILFRTSGDKSWNFKVRYTKRNNLCTNLNVEVLSYIHLFRWEFSYKWLYFMIRLISRSIAWTKLAGASLLNGERSDGRLLFSSTSSTLPFLVLTSFIMTFVKRFQTQQSTEDFITATCRRPVIADDWSPSFKPTRYAKSTKESGDRKLKEQTNYSRSYCCQSTVRHHWQKGCSRIVPHLQQATYFRITKYLECNYIE